MKRTNVVLWGLVLGLTGLWLGTAALAGDKQEKGEQSESGSAAEALTGDKPKKGAGSKSGSTSTELNILFRLAGRWKVEEQYPAAEGEEEGAKGKGAVILKKDLDKTYLIGDYGTKCKERGINVKGHMVFTYLPDSGTDSYRFWWFDNYLHQHEFVGHVTKNNRALVFTREDASTDPDNPITDRRTFTFKGEDEVLYKWEKGSGKQFREVMTATYTRRGKKTDAKDVKVAPKRVMRGM